MTINDLAVQATAFERWGTINFDYFKTCMLTETLLKEDEDIVINIYNEYLQENEYDSYFENSKETLQLLFGDNVDEAIRATQFGEYTYNDDYIKFNGYANLDSYRSHDVYDEAITDEQFKLWLFENYDNEDSLKWTIDFLNNNKVLIVLKALDLIKKHSY